MLKAGKSNWFREWSSCLLPSVRLSPSLAFSYWVDGGGDDEDGRGGVRREAENGVKEVVGEKF